MRKRTFLLFFALLLCFIPWEAPLGAQQEGEELARILDRLKKAQESMEDFTADITQVKNSLLFTEPVTSHGKMRFKRPNHVWVEMSPPYPSITVLSKGVLWIYFPEEKTAQRYRVAGNPLLAKWLLFFQNPIETMGRGISLQQQKAGEVVLGVDPADELAIFRAITLWIDTSLWMPKMIELVERNGDRTTITYHHIRINSGIPDSSFALRLPPDVEIIEPMGR